MMVRGLTDTIGGLALSLRRRQVIVRRKERALVQEISNKAWQAEVRTEEIKTFTRSSRTPRIESSGSGYEWLDLLLKREAFLFGTGAGYPSHNSRRLFWQRHTYIDTRAHFKPGNGSQPRHYPNMPVVIGILLIIGSSGIKHVVEGWIIKPPI